MSDRRIEIHLSLPQNGGGGAWDTSTKDTSRISPEGQDQARFEQALAGPATHHDGPPAPDLPPSPFSLFGTTPSPVSPGRLSPEDLPALGHHLDQAVESLMVDADHRGQRQVRMDLKDEVLPGVSIVVQHEQGRLQVDFICVNDESRLRLNRTAPTCAQDLATRLHTEVLVRVQTDDPEDLCLFEVAARP